MQKTEYMIHLHAQQVALQKCISLNTNCAKNVWKEELTFSLWGIERQDIKCMVYSYNSSKLMMPGIKKFYRNVMVDHVVYSGY